MAAIGQEALKETAFLTSLRGVDALIHVLRAFEDDSIAHVGPIDPLRDIKSVEFDLMVSDLTQVEKRLERVEKDLKKVAHRRAGTRARAAAEGQGGPGKGAAAARAGDDAGREESSSRASCFFRKSQFCMR